MTSKSLLLAAVVVLVSMSVASAQRVKPAAPAGMVNLPHRASDGLGNQWQIYQGGWMQQQGNTPVYGQSVVLHVNGAVVQNNTNTARLDAKTGEVVFDNMNPGFPGVTVTRRVLVDQKAGYLRYIDILTNTTPQEQSLQYMLQSNLNYGVASAQYINEPGGKGRALGWSAAAPAGRGAVELFAGRRAKVVPTLNWQQNSNFIQATMQLTIPPNKEIAVMHVHATSATPEAGIQQMLSLKESKLLEGVETSVRRMLVNFATGGGYVGDREVLRGDVLDVVELRGAAGAEGDQLKGTLKDNTLKLTTFYGEITLDAGKVQGLVNVGQFRPRQLVVTTDGEVFGGRLDKETVALELSSGQTTQIPLSQISRLGWRKRADENDDVAGDAAPGKPILLLRSGDRIAVEVPSQPIDVATRYGALKIAPVAIAAITFASEGSGVHQIQLTDGSRFAGLVAGEQFQFKLAGGAGGQSVTLPASSIERLQIVHKETEEPDDDAPTVELANDDLLVGTITGELKLDTAFDTITLNAPEIRTLSRNKDGGTDVQIELWDQSRLSGQLQQHDLSVALTSGLAIKAPLLTIDRYNQPLPQPSPAMIEKVKQLVGELSADDWKKREHAESQLVQMGIGVMATVKEMRPGVGPEAQQRIDSIVRQLEASRTKSMSNTGTVSPDGE